MMCPKAFLLVVVVVSVRSAWAQQLMPAFLGYAGTSQSCETALNTTVDCPAFLVEASYPKSRFDSDQVDALCSGSCATDLQAVRAKIVNACTASTDVIISSNIAYPSVYPATFIVDRYLFTCEMACFKYRYFSQDSSTGNYCDPATTSHPNPGYTFQQLPIAPGTVQGCASYANYDDDITDAALNSCSDISSAYWVDFSDLLTWNPSLSKNKTECAFQRGYSYCVEKTDTSAYVSSDSRCVPVDATEIQDGTASDCVCFTRVWGYDGTVGVDCAEIAEDASIKRSQLTTWNSWLGSNCDAALFANLDENDFRAVCIGINSSAPTATPTNPPSTPSGTQSSASMGLTPTGIIPNCQEFYAVQSRDSCAAIEGMFAISFADFYKWNPGIGSNCENLWLGYAYCVSAPSSSSGPPAPTQSGAAANCNKYYIVQNGDGCDQIESQFDITFQQLYQWNPAIGSDCTNIWLGYAICVGGSS